MNPRGKGIYPPAAVDDRSVLCHSHLPKKSASFVRRTMASQPGYAQQQAPPQGVCYQHYDPYSPPQQWSGHAAAYANAGAYQPQGWGYPNGGVPSQQYEGQATFYDPEHRGGTPGRDPREVWSDEKLRRLTEHGFIRKVYGIVSAQLALTFGVAFLFMFNKALQQVLLTYAFPLVMAATVALVIMVCVMMCNPQLLRTYPSNYIFLLLFTLAESVGISLVCVVSGSTVVFQGVAATVVIVVALTAFAFQTKYDFTSWMGFLYFVLIGFVVFGLLKALFFRSPTLDLVYAVCGAGLFGIYLVVDTQLLMSRSQFSLGSDDYILAALTIYLDVINLFLQLLEILRDCQSSSG